MITDFIYEDALGCVASFQSCRLPIKNPGLLRCCAELCSQYEYVRKCLDN